MKLSRKASVLKKTWRDLEWLKGLVLNVVQSSSKSLKDIEKDLEEINQGSMKRSASAKEDIKTEVKKLNEDTMEDVLIDEEELNQNTNPAIGLFKL